MKSKTSNNSSSNNSSNSNSNNKYTERWIGLAAPLVTFPQEKLQSQSLKRTLVASDSVKRQYLVKCSNGFSTKPKRL